MMMRKYVLILVIIVTGAASCLKSKDDTKSCDYDVCTSPAPAAEVTKVQEYLASKNITDAIKHCSGLYYQVITPGTGVNPGVCSYITINYKGQLTDDTVFDETTTSPRSWYLGELIRGWWSGLSLIKKGGKIRLFLPPSLGYGATTKGDIPGNSILIFEIELVDVQ